jgi:integrase
MCGDCSDDRHAQSATRPPWPYLGNLRFRDVRPEHVQQLIAAALANGYSPQTVRHIRSVISAVFSYAKQELVFMGNNPAGSAKMPEMIRKTTPDLTLAHVEQMLHAMRYPEKEMTLIALLTDMNVSEICGLQWKYVNLTGASSNPHGVPIPPLTIAVTRRWYRGDLADVKDARRRKIQIPEMLLPILLLLSGRTRFTGPDDFVLASRSGKAVNVTNITARRLGSIGRKLGIDSLTWQVLRRAQVAIKADHGQDFQYRIAAAAMADLPHDSPLTGRLSKGNELRHAPEPLHALDGADLSSVI